jgi:hypothetical protein
LSTCEITNSEYIGRIDVCLCEWQGKIITSAGMTAGIDMALKLATLITDEISARVVQLMMEYDPQPPFACGSVDRAAPEIISIAKDWLENLNCWTICPDPFCFAHRYLFVSVSGGRQEHVGGSITASNYSGKELCLMMCS